MKTHVGSIFAKLGVRDRAAAIVFAYDHGIVDPPPLTRPTSADAIHPARRSAIVGGPAGDARRHTFTRRRSTA